MSAIPLTPGGRDQFGNASAAAEGSIEAHIACPDGDHPLELKALRGLGLYEVTYDVAIKGKHAVHFLLNGADISGSPVEFDVSPAAALGTKSRTYPPTDPPTVGKPCELLLEAIDKFGNRLDRGGSAVTARITSIGGVAPPKNGDNNFPVEDNGDGSYAVTLSYKNPAELKV